FKANTSGGIAAGSRTRRPQQSRRRARSALVRGVGSSQPSGPCGDYIELGPVPGESRRNAEPEPVERERRAFRSLARHEKKHGTMMPENWKDQIGGHDALFFGACGWPATVPDHVSLWGMLIKYRREFDQYVNLRPCRLMPGIKSPLADRKPGDIDFFVVRENTEGEYSSVGGRMFADTDREIVFQQACFSRKGVDRILKFAFDLAMKRPKKHLTSATKSNGISITMPYWDERVEAMAKQYPAIKWDKFHIDILTAHFVAHPDWFDVVVASNLFGDILSDLGAAVVGSMGLAPAANINPEREYPSTFEPVHGSAPDIAGKGIANPVAQIW